MHALRLTILLLNTDNKIKFQIVRLVLTPHQQEVLETVTLPVHPQDNF